MKTERNLSGVFVRVQNPETKKWENKCFEDMSNIQQVDFLKTKEREWVEAMVIRLSDVINELGENFNITVE